MKPKNAYRWILGHLVIMTDARGIVRTEGQAIERTLYSVTMVTREGEVISGGTGLLLPPTGRKWPYGEKARKRPAASNKARSRR